MTKEKLTYKDTGVDVDAGQEVVKRIQPLAERVKRPEVLSGIGPFSSMFELKNYKKPVLVSSTDGVGTKLKVAQLVDKHDSIGIDLVAMCVNDLITCGAEPLFFLDYIATGKVKPDTITEIVKGIVQGCKESHCSLIGGETAEMPGMYSEEEYDVAGFSVGVIEKDEIIDQRFIESGDVIIGLASSGIHSNGYSLCRKLFFDKLKLSPFSHVDGMDRQLFEELLEPTKIYVKEILDLKKEFSLKSIAHITGGGFYENLPRSIPKEFQANIYNNSWEVPAIFNTIQKMANLEKEDMFGTFNMGIGMTVIVEDKYAQAVVEAVKNNNWPAYIIGKVSKKKVSNRVSFIDKK